MCDPRRPDEWQMNFCACPCSNHLPVSSPRLRAVRPTLRCSTTNVSSTPLCLSSASSNSQWSIFPFHIPFSFSFFNHQHKMRSMIKLTGPSGAAPRPDYCFQSSRNFVRNESNSGVVKTSYKRLWSMNITVMF